MQSRMRRPGIKNIAQVRLQVWHIACRALTPCSHTQKIASMTLFSKGLRLHPSQPLCLLPGSLYQTPLRRSTQVCTAVALACFVPWNEQHKSCTCAVGVLLLQFCSC